LPILLKMAECGTDIEKCAQLLREGKLVAIPTETVYGLAANAFNQDAVVSIYEAKNRPFFDPLIIHTDSVDKAKNFVSFFPEKAKRLADVFWPGPLTLLLPRSNEVPDVVTSGLDNVAIRVPDHELTLKLLEQLDFPLAAPSANPFGYVSPTEPEHVQKQLGNKIPYILDGGKCKVGIESTIIGFDGEDTMVWYTVLEV
jgi:L-threonylcarbamoyladenylate synthase